MFINDFDQHNFEMNCIFYPNNFKTIFNNMDEFGFKGVVSQIAVS